MDLKEHPIIDNHRRGFLRESALSLLGVAAIASVRPDVAIARPAPSVAADALDESERATLGRLAEVLLPGSQAAGVVDSVATQLPLPLERQTLMIKYLGVTPPFVTFYKTGLRALDELSRRRANVVFLRAREADATELVRQLVSAAPATWSGPPAGLFHFVVRNDALDVVYGTKDGFLELSTPYMAHIEPPSAWPR